MVGLILEVRAREWETWLQPQGVHILDDKSRRQNTAFEIDTTGTQRLCFLKIASER